MTKRPVRFQFAHSDLVTAGKGEIPVASPTLVPSFLGSPGRLLLFLGAVFATHVVVRLITSPATVLDESEQLVFSQLWQWGYGPQPPLYTWIQILVFKISGPSILGLSLLKNVLLFGIYAFTYGAGRIVTQSHAGGVIAALSLFFIPQLAWESQRDLTHSVLATFMASATLFIFLKLHLSRARSLYLLLGLLFGLGALSNHNYALLFVGLLGAALCLREFRALVLNPWMLVAIGIAALLVLPHSIWISKNWSTVVSTSHKLQIRTETSWLISALHALGSLAGAWFSHIASVVLILTVLCRKQLVPFPQEVSRRPPVRLIIFLLLSALVSVAIAMMTASATSIKGRWLQPLYSCVPILGAAFICERAIAATVRRIVGTATLIVAAIIILLPTRVWVAGRVGSLNTPYAELAAQIGNELDRADVLFADTKLTGGNLRLLFPSKRVVTPEFSPWLRDPLQTNVVVLFNATLANNPPLDLTQTLSQLGVELTPAEIHYVEAPLRWNSKERIRIGWSALRLSHVPARGK